MNKKGYFGNLFGGQFIPETAMHALEELEQAFDKFYKDDHFQEEYQHLLKNYLGRETPLTYAKNLSEHYQQNIYLKREDLNHTGSHKMNNALGQALLAQRMNKKKIIAETGAGQHGVATATAAALLGLECEVYMGAVDMHRQQLNVFRMELLGAKVIKVSDGLQTLKEATTAAIQAWVQGIEEIFYVIGSVVGPHPYPTMVKKFQSVIGNETKQQLQDLDITAHHIIACVGGGSNAMGIFSAFIEDETVKLYGIEAGGISLQQGQHAAAIGKGSVGVLHGMKTFVLQDHYGRILPVHSISAGLDYPGIGPEHSYLHYNKRVQYESVSDQQAMNALQLLTQKEGIIPALESAHALAYLETLCKDIGNDKKENIVVNVSGRGDKDMEAVFQYLNNNR